MFTLPEALEIKFNKHQVRGKSRQLRRIPILPARKFEKNGREIDVTVAVLNQIAANLRAKRPVTIAHPDLDKAPAVGWIVPGTMEVSAFGDGQALYAGIEFNEEVEEDIKAKKYGYISPVFSMDYTDEKGDDIGPVLLAAGITNNPHWASDQPELWQHFTAAISNIEAAKEAETQTEIQEESMEKLEQANARIQELEALTAELQKERDQLKGDVDKANKAVEQFAADASKVEQLTAQVAELQADAKQRAGQALLAKYDYKLRPKHLKDEKGNATKLYQFAFDNPDVFVEMVALIPEPEGNQNPVGDNQSQELVQMNARERACARAEKEAEKGGNFRDLYFKFLAEEVE